MLGPLRPAPPQRNALKNAQPPAHKPHKHTVARLDKTNVQLCMFILQRSSVGSRHFPAVLYPRTEVM